MSDLIYVRFADDFAPLQRPTAETAKAIGDSFLMPNIERYGPQVDACPDCGGKAEVCEEHETRYAIRCPACDAVYTYAQNHKFISKGDTFNHSGPSCA